MYFCHSSSADNSVRMFDRRNLTSNGVGSPVYKFEGHKAAVLCVQVRISLCVSAKYIDVFSSKDYFSVSVFANFICSLIIQWSPDRSSVFGSSAEDGLLNIWDYEKVSKYLHVLSWIMYILVFACGSNVKLHC